MIHVRDIIGTMGMFSSSRVLWGDISSTLMGYHDACGGYHQYHGGCLVPHVFVVQ